MRYFFFSFLFWKRDLSWKLRYGKYFWNICEMKFIVTFGIKRIEEIEYLWNNCSEEIEKNAISEGIIKNI